jgi:hypothetical protein
MIILPAFVIPYSSLVMSSSFPTKDIHNSQEKPHPYETFSSFTSCREFQQKVINPAICAAHECKHLFFKSEDPSILALQAPHHPLLELSTILFWRPTIIKYLFNWGLWNLIIPHQSAGIPVQGDNITFILGRFCSFYPDTFLAAEGWSVKVGDQILLGEEFRGVKVGGVCEVGNNFVGYQVGEVKGHLKSQTAVRCLVLAHFHPIYLHSIFLAVTLCFPFFQIVSGI